MTQMTGWPVTLAWVFIIVTLIWPVLFLCGAIVSVILRPFRRRRGPEPEPEPH